VAIITVNKAPLTSGAGHSFHGWAERRVNRPGRTIATLKTGYAAAFLHAIVNGLGFPALAAEHPVNHHTSVQAIVCEAATCAPARVLVWDGDSLLYDNSEGVRDKIRIENIDAPEINGRCGEESLSAVRAKDALANLLEGKTVSLQRGKLDRYGRQLARLRIGREDVGEALIAGGYVRRWSGRRLPWCRD